MRKNIQSIPQDRWNSPALFTLVDIGFTYNAHLRKLQHDSATSSAYAMYLLGAISLHIFGTKYRFQYQPICRTRSGPQATVLEQFFSRLCQSYSWLGGMNTEVAGKSNSKAYKLTSLQMVTMCKTINFSNITENLKSAHAKLDAILASSDSGEENSRKELEETKRKASRLEEEIREAWENDKPNRDRLIEAELAWCDRIDDYEKEIAHQRKINEALEALIEFEMQARQ